MLADLTVLLDAVPKNAPHASYRRAIQEENVLGKKTASTRTWAYKKLRELYGLDPELPVFLGLRARWDVDLPGRPMLAMLAALARDALLRATAPVVAGASIGEPVTAEQLRRGIVQVRGDRFSDSTMAAIISHLFSSWTESGHLAGKREKIRSRANTTIGATTYALTLGYLAGARGELLFATQWTSVLDAPAAVLHDHAREASRLGWLTYRGVGNIVDISFPDLVDQQELL